MVSGLGSWECFHNPEPNIMEWIYDDQVSNAESPSARVSNRTVHRPGTKEYISGNRLAAYLNAIAGTEARLTVID